MREQLPFLGRLWVLLCCIGGASEAADLPLKKTLFLLSEATTAPATRLLQPVATDATRAQLATADYSDSQEWQLEASGQPGRILIKHPKSNSYLMAEDIAEEEKPARVMLTAILPGGNVALTTAHQWRVLDAEGGAFMFQNVQTGRMLEADSATIASADGQTTLQALGRDGKTSPNRRWRMVQGGVQFLVSNGQLNGSQAIAQPTTPVSPILCGVIPAVTVPAAKTGQEDFQGDVQVTLTAELVGDGTSELSVKLTMKASDATITMEKTETISLAKAGTGKRLYLSPGYPTMETLTYTAKNEVRDNVLPKQMGTELVDPQKFVTATTTFDVAATNGPGIVAGCICQAKAAGPDEGKVAAVFVLVPIPFMIETP